MTEAPLISTMGSHGDEPLSLECVKRSDMYPRRSPVCDDPSIQQIPFPLLCGENGLFLGRCADGVVTLTNFRLHIYQRKSFVNIPLRLIECVEARDMFTLVVMCKDATTVRCKFACNDSCQLWLKRLVECTGCPKDLTKLFAFSFYSHGSELHESLSFTSHLSSSADMAAKLCAPLKEDYCYTFGKDVQRMRFDLSRKKVWRILLANEDYSLCPSYPTQHIVPAAITDQQVHSVAGFRSGGRFPSVVWRDQRNGAVIARCSQPELGWLGWRNAEDELMARAIPEACAQDVGTHNYHCQHPDSLEANGEDGSSRKAKVPSSKKMLVVDCRSYSVAFANRAKGGGCESPDYYTNCEIKFMNMANIHSIRKSYQALRLLCSNFPDQSWLSSLEATKWLQHIAALLYGAQVVVGAVEDARPVLIHCSDGWDRTAQISSMAQLLLDPFYRTIQGFQWLVEREWVHFGHKFADRCGHAVGSGDVNEQSPVFVQWLDCVYQVMRQYPCHFQFNEAFLIKLVQHTYACLFGTFLFNTCRERQEESRANPTSCVWTLLHADNTKFHNPLYNPQATEVLVPEWSMYRLALWSSVYLSNNSLKTSSGDEFVAALEQADQVLTPEEDAPGLSKTRSCDNLTTVLNGPQDPQCCTLRRSSDPNLGCPQDNLALISKELDPNVDCACDNPPPLSSNDSSKDSLNPCNHNGHASELNGNGSNLVESDLLDEGVGDADTTLVDVSPRDGVCNRIEGLADGCPRMNNNSLDQHSPGVESSRDDSASSVVPVKTSSPVSNCQDDILVDSPAFAKDCAKEEEEARQAGSRSCNGENNAQLACTTVLQSNYKPIDSSTDTLTDAEDIEKSSLVKSPKFISSENPGLSQRDIENGGNMVCDLKEEEEAGEGVGRNQLDAASVKSLKLLIQKNCSISTSTTDISDSTVAANGNGVLLPHLLSQVAALHLGCSHPGTCGVGGLGRQTPSSSEASPSVCSVSATPIICHTPPSTASPTPSAQGKLSEPALVRPVNSVGRHLDVDGLSSWGDPGLQRMQDLLGGYQQEVQQLTARLRAASLFIQHNMQHCNGAGHAVHLNQGLQSEPCDGGELSSLGAESNPASVGSDVSWEEVDATDTPVTLWVPDHMVKDCATCGQRFTVYMRRHHCRNCGKIYCGNCCNNYSPVPAQQLTSPVRVCRACYTLLIQPGPAAASDDSRISLAAD